MTTKRQLWSVFNYRCSHAVVRLVPAMLIDKYEQIIDGKIIRFNRDYIIWRICLLLKSITQYDRNESIALLKDAINYLEIECTTTDGDDSNQSTPA